MKINYIIKNENDKKIEIILETQNYATGRAEIAKKFEGFRILKEIHIKEGVEAEILELEKTGDWAIKKAILELKHLRCFGNSDKKPLSIQEVENLAALYRKPVLPEKNILNAADAENYLYEMDMAGVDSITLKESFNQSITITRDEVLSALPHLKK